MSKNRIYLDNAATTAMDDRVIEVMTDFMKEHFGNPSSTHAYGRKVKDTIETCRRRVAQILNCSPAEICFTSGGTEADNLAISHAVLNEGVTDLVTTRIEHAAVIRSCEEMAKRENVRLHLLDLDEKGHIDLAQLSDLLQETEKTMVCLMHANNEIGNKLDLHAVSKICRQHDALFMSDTVQTMAHYSFDLEELDVDYITASAHKFHGPKGIGFLYHKRSLAPNAMIVGGGQERGRRSGTENVYGIVGLTEALELANKNMEANQQHVRGLKSLMIQRFKEQIPGIAFNGDSESEDSLHTVLSCNLPDTEISGMILFRLDIEGIACSGGSACSSGNTAGSHVLNELKLKNTGPNIRFSFSHMNTKEDIEIAVQQIADLMAVTVK